MPHDRLFHPELGHSVKVNTLTDFEEIVWRTYIMAADDFGVMRFQPLPLQNFYDRLAQRPAKAIQRALERIEQVGLIRTFEHQGCRYCFQDTWQNYQKIEYPRTTILPRPPAELLSACSEKTRHLFNYHPGGVRVPPMQKRSPVAEDLANISQALADDLANGSQVVANDLPPSRARSRAPGRTLTANANANGSRSGGEGGAAVALELRPSEASDEIADRAARFVERYAELFAEHRRGARYHSKPTLDYQEALGLVSTWEDDARLEQLVIAFLTTDDPFCRNGNGSIAQFRSRASWCDSRLREAGL